MTSALPKSLETRTPQWFIAVVLQATSDIAKLLATFMPMKSILILASGDVPGFFPRYLVESGPTDTVLFLLSSAIFCAGVAWGFDKVCEGLDSENFGILGKMSRPPEERQVARRRALHRRNLEVTAALAALILGLLITVSIPYLVFLNLWLVLSLAGILLKLLISSKRGPYYSGVDQLSHELASWLERTSLPSMVGLALLTLLVSPPALGSTAVLIAAIFGRRLVQALAQYLPPLATLLTNSTLTFFDNFSTNFIVNKAKSLKVESPAGFVASEIGLSRLKKSLELAGFEGDKLRLIGRVSGQSISVLVVSVRGTETLFRIFGSRHVDDRDRELMWRRFSGHSNPFPSAKSQSASVSGFPAITVELINDRDRYSTKRIPSKTDAIRFQIQQELSSTRETQDLELRLEYVEFWADLEELLGVTGHVADKHQSHLQAIRAILPVCKEYISLLRPSLVPSRAIQSTDLYISRSGTAVYLGGQTWSPGLMGSAWLDTKGYARVLCELSKHYPATFNPEIVMLNADLHSLERVLRHFRFEAIPSYSRTLRARVDKISQQENR